MDRNLLQLYQKIQEKGLTPDQERKFSAELDAGGSHDFRSAPDDAYHLADTRHPGPLTRAAWNFYAYSDLVTLQNLTTPPARYDICLRSIDELLQKDRQREEDGFPRKIRVGRLIKPGRGRQGKVVVVPTTVEEKFVHDSSFKESLEEGTIGGSGEGEEGEIIGEQPVRPSGGEGAGAGGGEGGPHELESSAYDLGKILTEQFQLPNLQNKGKNRSLTRDTYDLTDKHRGFGQLLDKKATLRKILETNLALGNVPDVTDIDTTRFLIAPRDKIYRILSREKDFESQAMVFFLRDYSASMAGKPTDLVVAQHVMIYSWLLYQYAGQVESRFILHDTEANEVEDFYTYYNSRVAGGTKVASAFHLVNEIVDKENLARDYNIYVFYGTDGDDWDTEGDETIPEIETMMSYVNRIGVTIAQRDANADVDSEVEKYLKASGLLEKRADLIRLDAMPDDSDESRQIEGIKRLISEQPVATSS